MISVSLEKRVENVVVNLQKRTTKQLKDVNLNLCLDVSGSTYSEYRSNSAGSQEGLEFFAKEYGLTVA